MYVAGIALIPVGLVTLFFFGAAGLWLPPVIIFGFAYYLLRTAYFKGVRASSKQQQIEKWRQRHD
jgi:hypothetical protein